MSTAEIIFFIIRMLVEQGLPALDKILGLIKRYKGAESVPVEEWDKMFTEHVKGYWEVVDKPEE